MATMSDKEQAYSDSYHSSKALSVALSREQEVQLAELQAAVEPAMQGDAHLTTWCTPSTMRRYLVARSWNVQAAAKMLKATFEWRTSYKPHHITWDVIKEEAVTGKQYICTFPDKEGRPVLVMRPRCENTKPSDRQLQYLIYHLERASAIADESGVGKMTWLIDFPGYSMSKAPPIKTQIWTTQILQNHYPERLGLAVCYFAPRLFSLAYKATKPFIDPVTFRKIVFVDKGHAGDALMSEKFPMAQMEKCLGGSSDWAFSLERYAQEMRKQDDSKLHAVTSVQAHSGAAG